MRPLPKEPRARQTQQTQQNPFPRTPIHKLLFNRQDAKNAKKNFLFIFQIPRSLTAKKSLLFIFLLLLFNRQDAK